MRGDARSLLLLIDSAVIQKFADVISFLDSVGPQNKPIVDLAFRKRDLLSGFITFDQA